MYLTAKAAEFNLAPQKTAKQSKRWSKEREIITIWIIWSVMNSSSFLLIFVSKYGWSIFPSFGIRLNCVKFTVWQFLAYWKQLYVVQHNNAFPCKNQNLICCRQPKIIFQLLCFISSTFKFGQYSYFNACRNFGEGIIWLNENKPFKIFC